MELVPVPNAPRFHETPLPSFFLGSGRLLVELDDENERRLRLLFEPCQAVRVTTCDCFDMPDLDEDALATFPTIFEVVGSTWIDDLRKTLRKVDKTADFLAMAKHYYLPLQDDQLEVVSWGFRVQEESDQETPRAT